MVKLWKRSKNKGYSKTTPGPLSASAAQQISTIKVLYSDDYVVPIDLITEEKIKEKIKKIKNKYTPTNFKIYSNYEYDNKIEELKTGLANEMQGTDGVKIDYWKKVITKDLEEDLNSGTPNFGLYSPKNRWDRYIELKKTVVKKKLANSLIKDLKKNLLESAKKGYEIEKLLKKNKYLIDDKKLHLYKKVGIKDLKNYFENLRRVKDHKFNYIVENYAVNRLFDNLLPQELKKRNISDNLNRINELLKDVYGDRTEIQKRLEKIKEFFGGNGVHIALYDKDQALPIKTTYENTKKGEYEEEIIGALVGYMDRISKVLDVDSAKFEISKGFFQENENAIISFTNIPYSDREMLKAMSNIKNHLRFERLNSDDIETKTNQIKNILERISEVSIAPINVFTVHGDNEAYRVYNQNNEVVIDKAIINPENQ